MRISMIVAADEQNGIGKDNQLLCYLPEDLKYFKRTTTGHHVAMGRKTFESVGKPLPNRTNLIITSSNTSYPEGCVICRTIEEAVEYARSHGETELFITGGGSIYKASMNITDRIYITRIHNTFNADTFFPIIDPIVWQLVSSEMHEADEKNKFAYSFEVFDKITA